MVLPKVDTLLILRNSTPSGFPRAITIHSYVLWQHRAYVVLRGRGK